jgi:hypothetical protein
MRSFNWKRSLFYDFGPLLKDEPRKYELEQMLARQGLLLVGMTPPESGGAERRTLLTHMADGTRRLKALLDVRCEVESDYQELLAEHPWMFGAGRYSIADRHTALDDQSIPDFTAVRCIDDCRDIIELKHPFLPCVRKKKPGFSSEFNDAWNQAEQYLAFTSRQRDYLRTEKGLVFDNPKVLLLFGHKLTTEALQKVRQRQNIARTIEVITYDQLLMVAEGVLALMQSAGESAALEGTTLEIASPTENTT